MFYLKYGNGGSGDISMAIVLKGKLKGQEVSPCQWCNDWVMVKETNKVFSITNLEFSRKEMVNILTSKDLGFMLEEFERVGNRFKRKK